MYVYQSRVKYANSTNERCYQVQVHPSHLIERQCRHINDQWYVQKL